MVEATGQGDGWLQAVNSLPPPLQGIAVFGVAIGIGVILGRRFLRRLVQPPPEQKVIAVGEPTAIADMGPVRDLLKNVDLMNIQLMKNEVQMSSIVVGIGQTNQVLLEVATGIKGLVSYLREEHDRAADASLAEIHRQEGRQQLIDEMRAAKRPRRRPVRKITNTA